MATGAAGERPAAAVRVLRHPSADPVVTASTSADIRRFGNLGHKIVWYQGLSDPGAPTRGTIH